MSTLKLHTLKQKLWAVVAASFVARVIVFFGLPNTSTQFAPDEATYMSLIKWVGESKPAREFPAYGEGLYLSGRAIFIPALMLFRLGLNELTSLRIISTLYGLCALIIIVILILKLIRDHTSVTKSPAVTFNERLIVGLVAIYALVPSHFIWSNLGLRESATEFWMLASFITFFYLYNHQKRLNAIGIYVLVFSIAFAFNTRGQVAWVVCISIIFYLLLNLKEFNTYFMIILVLCGVLLGSALSQTNTSNTSNTVSQLLNPLTSAGEVISYKQEANQIGAASVIKTQSCPREGLAIASTPPTKFDTYFCIAWRAPYMVSTFLFRPIIGVDITSTSSLIAAVENIFWFGLFVTIIVLATRRRAISFLAPILPALIFLVLYVMGASAYQGNMGTGFRHKSLILWAVLLLIFALAWKRPEETSEKPRNNSQESAV